MRVAVESETPSPMAPLEPPNFEIGSPPRGGPMASAEGQFAEAVKLLENANQDLLKRLDIANEKIVELAMKNSALQTELNMRTQIEGQKGMGGGVGARRVEWNHRPTRYPIACLQSSAARGEAASSTGIRHCPMGLGEFKAAVRCLRT